MTTPAELYVNGIKKKLKNYWAAWLPNSKFNLGDVGTLDGNIFKKFSSLEALKINFDVEKGNSPSPIDYVSESGVSMFLKVAGQTNSTLPNIPQAQAGIGVEFGTKGAFVVQASETYEHSIRDILSLENSIIDAYTDGSWDKHWFVIVKLIEAPVATFLISNSSQSKIELSIEGNLSSGLAQLGKAETQCSITAQQGDILKIIGARNVSPLFQLARIKTRWFQEPTLKFIRPSESSSQLDLITPELLRDNPDLKRLLYFDTFE